MKHEKNFFFLITETYIRSSNCWLLSSFLVNKSVWSQPLLSVLEMTCFSETCTACTSQNFKQWQSKTYWWIQPEKNLYAHMVTCLGTQMHHQSQFLRSSVAPWLAQSTGRRRLSLHQCLSTDLKDCYNVRKPFANLSGCVFFKSYCS